MPSNLRQLFSDINPFGSDKDFTEANLDKDEYAAAQELVRRIQAQGRSNISYDDFNTTGGNGYSDVGGGGAFGLKAAYDKFKDPMYSLKTLIGRGNITTNDAGETIITDRYNFNEPNPQSLGDYRKKAALVASNPLYQGPRQLGSIFGSDEGEGSFVRLNLGNLNPQTSAQGGLTRHFKNGGNTNMNLEQQTQNVAARGRYGDSMLLHVNPAEVAGLSQVMPLTINPDTGQPEAFLPFLAPILGSIAGGSLFGGTLGAGLSSALGSGLATWAATGSGKKGLMAGLTGYGIGKMLGGASNLLGKGAEAAGTQTLATAAAPRALHAPPSMSVPAPTTAVASKAFNPIQSIKDISGSGMEGLKALGTSASRAGTYMPMYAGLAGQGIMESQENFANQMAQLQLDDTEEYNRIIAEHPEYVPMLRGNTTYASNGGVMGYAAGGNARAVAGVETRPIDPFFMAGFQPETPYLKNLNPSSGQIISGQSGYDYGTEIENRPMSGPFDPTQTTGYQNFYNAPAASYVLDPYQKVDLGSLPERREPINEMPQPIFPSPIDNPNRYEPQPMPPVDFNPVNAVTPSEDLTNPTASMYGSSPETTSGLGFNAPMPINNIGANLPSIMGGFGSYSPTNIVSPESTMFGSFGGGAIPTDFDPTTGELGYRAQNMQDIINTGQFIGTPDQATAVAGMAAAELNQRVADGDASAISALASEVSKAKAAQGAADNAADTAGYQRDKASAMNVLYGGAGSSFESGRNEYTESGQYDIDKAARDAEFDAMRDQERINAGLPPISLTAEETQQAVKDMQAGIGADFRAYLQDVQAPDTSGAYAAGLAAREKAAADEERGFVDYGEPVFAAPNAQPVSDVIERPQQKIRPIGRPIGKGGKGRRGGRARKAAGGTTDLPNKGLEALNKVAPNVVDRMGFQEGGLTQETMSDPLTIEVVQYITGQSSNDAVIGEFVTKYGNEAFMQLREMALQQIDPNQTQTEGLVTGTNMGGMSDDIPMTVSGQPAAVSQGEFIVPSDVVSMIGDGDTNSGGNELYAMMDRVRQTKTGTTQQAPRLANAGGLMPA